MSPPSPPVFDPHDAWDTLVRLGVSKNEATRHVMRQIANQPEDVQRQYLKDVDPGALASFGLGAADAMSFGIGDKVARLVWGKEAVDTQQAASQEHPIAHAAGEVAGAIGPAALDYGLAKAGVLTAGRLGRLVQGISNKPARIAAKTALNTAIGAAYGGAQGIGHAESLPGAVQQGEQGAMIGGLLGGGVPLVAQGVGEMFSPLGRYLGRVGDRVAGPGPTGSVPLKFSLSPEIQALPPGIPQVPTPRPPPDPLEIPTFMRRRPIAEQVNALTRAPAPVPAESPLLQTPAEKAATAGGKAMQAARRAAARAAYSNAIAAGQSLEDATIAARWAATHVGLLGP